MIVCINYNTDGSRYIANLHYTTFIDALDLKDSCEQFKHHYDEVYTIDLNPNHKDFIQEIVLHGCRM